MMDCINAVPLDVRLGIIGSIFSEKIEFDGTNYRTTKLNDVAALIFNNDSELQKEKRDADYSTSRSVPRVGLFS